MPDRTFTTTFSHVAGVAGHLVEAQGVERQAGGLHASVVAGDAVLREERGRRRRCARRRLLRLKRRHRKHDGPRDGERKKTFERQLHRRTAAADSRASSGDEGHRGRLRLRRVGGEEHASRPGQRRPPFAVFRVELRALRDEEPDDVVRAAVGGAVQRRQAHRVHAR